MEKIRVGFIGCGHFVLSKHFDTARHWDQTEVRALADLDQARLDKFKGYAPDAWTTKDYKDILKDPDVDVVVIGTKQDLHARLIIESLDAGKWVYCEKPMSETEEESRAVIEAEKRNPGKLAVGYNRRFAPSIQRVRQLMKQMEPPYIISYRLMSPAMDYQKKGAFYHDRPRILYEGSHILDLVCWLVGSAPSTVYMTGDLHDNVCSMTFPDGSQWSFICGSMGNWTMTKEHMEIYSRYKALVLSEFIDLRVRGFKGEYDQFFGTHSKETNEKTLKYGLDYWESILGLRSVNQTPPSYYKDYGIVAEHVKRPRELPCEIVDFQHEDPEFQVLMPDKGWFDAFKDFCLCFRENREPDNANGHTGSTVTLLADKLVESMKAGKPLPFEGAWPQ
jgi:predicted dehydrogenase